MPKRPKMMQLIICVCDFLINDGVSVKSFLNLASMTCSVTPYYLFSNVAVDHWCLKWLQFMKELNSKVNGGGLSSQTICAVLMHIQHHSELIKQCVRIVAATATWQTIQWHITQQTCAAPAYVSHSSYIHSHSRTSITVGYNRWLKFLSHPKDQQVQSTLFIYLNLARQI